MGVKARSLGVTLDVDDLAAAALAEQLKNDTGESIAVARCSHGDYIVMPYRKWQHIADTAEAQGSRLVKVCYA